MVPPTSKRKREDDDDDAASTEADQNDKAVVASRSSKKAKLEEAKRRAKEWGLQDKKKLEATKGLRHSVEKPLSSPTAGTKGAAVPPVLEPSVPQTTPKSTKTPPRKARVSSSSTTKKSSATGATSTTTKASASKAPSVSTTAPTTTTNNNNNSSSRDSTPIISATPANTPILSLSSQSMASNPYATGVVAVNPEYMAQYMMTHQPPAALFPQPAYSAPAGYVPSNAAPLIPGFYPYTALMMQQPQMVGQQLSSGEASSKLSAPVTTAIPPPVPSSQPTVKPVSTVSKTKKNVPKSAIRPDSPASEDDEFIPPPPTLQMQISQQVLANASASLKNQPAPHTKPPPEAFSTSSYPNGAEDDDDQSDTYEHDDQPIIVDEEDPSVEDFSTAVKHPTSFMHWFVLVIAVAMMISLLAANTPSSSTPSTPSKSITEAQIETSDIPCFQDSQPQYQMIGDGDEMHTILIEPCENLHTMLPCPTLGFCQDGKLVRCIHESFQVNAAGTACELTPTTQHEVVALWVAALEDRTIADLCVAGGSHAELPLFDYTKLQLLYPSTLAIHPLDKTVMQAAFATQEEEGRWFIGLPDDHSIILPLRCRMAHFISKLLKTILAWIGSLCWKMVTLCTKIMWSMMSTYPLISLIGLLTVLGVRQVQSFQKHRINLVKDVARMRDMAFDKLQDQSDIAHAVLHLRDDIVAELTAHENVLNGLASRQRQYWITNVWPRVIPQLQQDNRIKKTQRVEMGGKRRDYWQWVAAARSTTKPKKHVSIVTTTTMDHPADTNYHKTKKSQ